MTVFVLGSILAFTVFNKSVSIKAHTPPENNKLRLEYLYLCVIHQPRGCVIFWFLCPENGFCVGCPSCWSTASTALLWHRTQQLLQESTGQQKTLEGRQPDCAESLTDVGQRSKHKSCLRSVHPEELQQRGIQGKGKGQTLTPTPKTSACSCEPALSEQLKPLREILILGEIPNKLIYSLLLVGMWWRGFSPLGTDQDQ